VNSRAGADVQPELDDLKIFEQDAEDGDDGAPAKVRDCMRVCENAYVYI